jgi:OOP family OmpA-OmpF porin
MPRRVDLSIASHKKRNANYALIRRIAGWFHGLMNIFTRASNKSASLILLLACVALPHAHAQEALYEPDYFSMLPGYSLPAKALGTTGSGATISGIYGREIAPHFAAEVNAQYSTFETGLDNGTDFYQSGATLDLVYQAFDRRGGHFTPFVLAGLGGAYDDFYPKSKRGAAFNADAGVGVVSQPLFARRLRLRFDARYVYDAKNGGHGEGRLLAGLEIPLGRIERQTVYLPGPVQVREVIKEVDRPWVDADGDGVDDAHDLCPNTPPDFKVDAHGCMLDNQIVRLRGVTFEFGKSRLTPNAQTVLDLVSRAFAEQPTLSVEIAGHTDSVGGTQANQKLSQTRADAVREYLMAKGVRPERLVATGYGKSQLLIDPEKGEADRERNRRVELRVAAH